MNGNTAGVVIEPHHYRTGRMSSIKDPILFGGLTATQKQFVRGEYAWQRRFNKLSAVSARASVARWLMYFGPKKSA